MPSFNWIFNQIGQRKLRRIFPMILLWKSASVHTLCFGDFIWKKKKKFFFLVINWFSFFECLLGNLIKSNIRWLNLFLKEILLTETVDILVKICWQFSIFSTLYNSFFFILIFNINFCCVCLLLFSLIIWGCACVFFKSLVRQPRILFLFSIFLVDYRLLFVSLLSKKKKKVFWLKKFVSLVATFFFCFITKRRIQKYSLTSFGIIHCLQLNLEIHWIIMSTSSGPYNYSYIFKYIIIGDMGVGKSCLLHHFTDKKCLYFGFSF